MSQWTLFWCQKGVLTTNKASGQHDRPTLASATDPHEDANFMRGYLAIYLENTVAWIPLTGCLNERDLLKYELLSRRSIKEESNCSEWIENLPDENLLVADPKTLKDQLDYVFIVSLDDLMVIRPEFYISEDLGQVYPKVAIEYQAGSKVKEKAKEFIFTCGDPASFIESIKCFVPPKTDSKGGYDTDVYTLDHSQSIDKAKSCRTAHVSPPRVPLASWFSTSAAKVDRQKIHDAMEETAWSVLGTFSNLTHIARSIISSASDGEKTLQKRPDKTSTEYIDLFTRIETPKVSPSWTGTPLNERTWDSLLDEAGKLAQFEKLSKLIIAGGIDSSLRKTVWPYLFQLYDWSVSKSERESTIRDLTSKYYKLKDRWQKPNDPSQSLAIPSNEKEDTWAGSLEMSRTLSKETYLQTLNDAQYRIIKDVLRTDRHIPYYSSHLDFTIYHHDCAHGLDKQDYIRMVKLGHENLDKLKDILITLSLYDPELGYVQGMSDLLSPFLFVLHDEATTFWAFVSFMNTWKGNFEEGSHHIQASLKSLASLIQLLLPEFYIYLQSRSLLNLFFCYRWLLILFKREFCFHDDILKLWETLALSRDVYGCVKYELFVALAILKLYQVKIMKECQNFDDILKLINELSMKLNLPDVLMAAEALFYKFKYLADLMNLPQYNELVL